MNSDNPPNDKTNDSAKDDQPDVEFEEVIDGDEFLGDRPEADVAVTVTNPTADWAARADRDLPETRVRAVARTLCHAATMGHLMVAVCIENATMKDRIPQMNKGAGLVAEVAGGEVLPGGKEWDALQREGWLRMIAGFWGTEDFDTPLAVNSTLRTRFSKGLHTSEGVTIPHKWRARNGQQPRIVVIGAGKREILEAVYRHFGSAAGIDKSHLRFCLVERPGDNARIGAFVELPKSIVATRIWPGIDKTPEWAEYVAILARAHTPVGDEADQDSYGITA